jgi:hypothetical protein
MMARFVAARRPEFFRKSVLIAVAAIAVVIACAAVAFSQTGPTKGGYVLVDGVLKPDGAIQEVVHHIRIVYSHDNANVAARMAASTGPRSTTVSRNGKTWLTLTTATDGTITISDPNGSGKPVITIPSSRAAAAKPETR